MRPRNTKACARGLFQVTTDKEAPDAAPNVAPDAADHEASISWKGYRVWILLSTEEAVRSCRAQSPHQPRPLADKHSFVPRSHCPNKTRDRRTDLALARKLRKRVICKGCVARGQQGKRRKGKGRMFLKEGSSIEKEVAPAARARVCLRDGGSGLKMGPRGS